MFKHTQLLSQLMDQYRIATLFHGAREDKLGDVFEDYTVNILNSSLLLEKAKENALDAYDTDEFVFYSIYKRILTYSSNIHIISLNATRNIEHRLTGGNPKTDVIVDIHTEERDFSLPISVKHTTAAKVAMAEFDVDTIVREIGIKDQRLISLLEKHQHDASAKFFTPDEKMELFDHLTPYRNAFVRWVITGTPTPSSDLRFPELLLKFNLDHLANIKDINCYTPDEYVNALIYDKNGNVKKGGFGTGLSWTYATGSKGSKIQFKG